MGGYYFPYQGGGDTPLGAQFADQNLSDPYNMENYLRVVNQQRAAQGLPLLQPDSSGFLTPSSFGNTADMQTPENTGQAGTGGIGPTMGGFNLGSLFGGGGNSFLGVPGTNSIPGIGDLGNNLDWSKILTGITGGIPGIGGSGSGSGGNGSNQLPASLLSLAAAIGPGLFGAIDQSQQQNWNNGGKINVLQYLRGLGDQAQGQQTTSQQSYLPQMLQQLGISQGLTNNLQGANASGLASALADAPGAFTTAKDPYATVPGLESIINFLGGTQGQNVSALSGLQKQLSDGPINSGQSTANSIATGNNPNAARLSQLSQLLTNGQSIGQPNSATNQASGIAGNILSHNPLLSMDAIKSMAIDQNATQSINAANKNRRDLLNRTGVTGPAIASGQQNELLGSSMDQALQNQASGVTQAVLGQQGLQNQLYNTGASLFGSAQNAGLNQQQLALQQMLGGAGLLSNNQGTQVSALNALANLGNTQNSGYNALSGLTNNMSNNALQEGGLLQGAQQLGLSQNTNLYNALSSLLGQQGSLAGQAQTGLFNAAQFPQNTYNQNTGLLQNLASNNVGLFGSPSTPQNMFSIGNLLGK